MKPMFVLVLLIASLLPACGGPSAPSHGDDEVSATWTAGDDAPLQDDEAGDAGPTATE